ncbi:class D sortase, partial [Phascolarctobacterium succinatutens]|uniref:class D sortase n=1 Tax=Phascolarctobacterium succinatutens TaxID=626940 RepID=UPI003FD877BD
LSMQHENGDAFVEIKPIPTPKATNVFSSTSLPSPAAALPPPTPEATLQPVYTPTATPAPMQGGRAFFTLSILNDTISVAYGVEESTLKKTPGWLTTSVLPGESGMCVVYGHRNRNHLKILEKVTVGDTITATKDGIAYTYTVSDVAIYESTSDWRLPTLDGSTLVLVTCYPFRYSGHAPGKYMVTAQLVE